MDAAERKWLKLAAPLVQVGTVAETLNSLKLSDKLLARRDEILAVINVSEVAKIEKEPDDFDDLIAIQAWVEVHGLPATEADCATIAEAFGRRREVILKSYKARNTAKVSKTHREILQADSTLKEMRDRLVVNYEGAVRQDVDAQVVDSGLQDSIGETIRLRFPDSAWDPGRFSGDDVQVLIRGTYDSNEREQIEAPLLVRFRQGAERSSTRRFTTKRRTANRSCSYSATSSSPR